MTDTPRDPSIPVGMGAVDLTGPNTARMHDYLLGGAVNAAVDRAQVDQLTECLPDHRWLSCYAQANRAFLARAVRACVEAGIDQFLDLGSGVPTNGNVHEIAQRVAPHARVAYVDHDPIAVHHAQHMLAGQSQVTITHADARQVEVVLNAAGVAGLLDFTRPVAVLAVALLELLDVAPAALVGRYRQACVPGSYLVLSHMAQLSLTDAHVTAFRARLAETPTSTPHIRFATHADLDRVAATAGYQWIAPGVVPLDHWRPENPVTDAEAARSNGYAAVGVLTP
ncbi:SAM-dependent methyltransferase [Actinopolyspora halophila]|uniref:SAM-dependent methyltransferase n=1 Tax=Actinopolyspora halophila TaxID=1850 RepID=UPI00036AA8BA|nr:SAM-dependent methyltransferase [Actinopolyspora halophila]